MADRNAAERELTTLISRALRSIPYVKLDRVDEVAESFREALALLEANCDLTPLEREELEKIRRMDGAPEAPTHIPVGWPPVDSDDDDSDDDRKSRSKSGSNTTGGMIVNNNGSSHVTSGGIGIGNDGKEVKRVPSANASSLTAEEEKARLMGLAGANRPITKEIGISASPRSTSRGLGAAGAPVKRSASSRAPKTGVNNPNLPDDLTTSSSAAVISAGAAVPLHVTSGASSSSSSPSITSIGGARPGGGRAGHDGSPMLTPRSIGRKMAGKGNAASSSPRRQLGLGTSSLASSSSGLVAKPKSRFETVVQRPASDDDDDDDDDGEGDDDDDDAMDDSESKIEQKMSPTSAFNHNMKKRPRQSPRLPAAASPAHFASSRVLLQLASAPPSPTPDFHELLPAEARAIIGPLSPASSSSSSVMGGMGLTGLPNAAAPVPGSPGSTGTPKPAFLRRLDSPQSHHGKLLAMKSKLTNMLMQSVHILPKMRPAAYDKVRAAFLDAVTKLERATVEAQ